MIYIYVRSPIKASALTDATGLEPAADGQISNGGEVLWPFAEPLDADQKAQLDTFMAERGWTYSNAI